MNTAIRVTTEWDAVAEAVLIPCFQGIEAVEAFRFTGAPTGVEAAISDVFERGDFEGKKLQTAVLYAGKGLPRVVLFGLGSAGKDFDVRVWKQAVGAGVVSAQQKKTGKISVIFPGRALNCLGAKRISEATAVAVGVSGYSFDVYKGKEDRVVPITDCSFEAPLAPSSVRRQIEGGVASGQVIYSAINHLRALGNTPPSHMTPTVLANEAVALSKKYPKIKITALSRVEMKKLGMGCVLGVAQGSHQEPKFVILEYMAGKKGEKPTVLVGKGITFDSGGLSIKPSDAMCDMKYDMLGAATVLATVEAAAGLGLKVNLVGLFPATENMPGGGAYRPDDILTAMNGKTVEIGNTDAEGRLILADALSYAKKYNPKEVVDFATLTMACLVAIGNERSGLFTPEDRLAKKLQEAAEAAGEQLWRLPLGEEYTDAVKSEVADVRNVGGVGGNSRYGGASNAAAFLQRFTDYSWAHIDLSCSYYGGKGRPWIRHGANGFGVATMVEYLRK